MFRFNTRLDSVEAVLSALIDLLNDKGYVTREEIQKMILENSTMKYIEKGGIVYKVDKDE